VFTASPLFPADPHHRVDKNESIPRIYTPQGHTQAILQRSDSTQGFAGGTIRRMRNWAGLAILLMTGCSNDAADGGGGDKRGCGMLDGPEPPADICALADTRELLRCERAPFHYSRQRDGMALRIECHALGDLPARGSEYKRWISDRDDVSIGHNLRSDWSQWPMAECDLAFTVSTFSSIGQQIPDHSEVEASMWAHDNTVTAGVLPPLAADSVVFAASECTYEAPQPR
jgi:hypothetical protein